MRKSCIIFDIDGTLADLSHRKHLVAGKFKDWDTFDSLIPKDLPIKETIFLNNLLYKKNDWPTFVVSGRGERTRENTTLQLANFGVKYDELFLRPDGDYRADHIIKMEILQKIRDKGYEPYLIFDDRQSVVDAWRSEGLFVLQADPNPSETMHDIFQFDDAIDFPLHIMVGPSGSGKSTFVNDFISMNRGYSAISSDDIRHSLTGDFRDMTLGEKVFDIMHDVALNKMKHGLPVILDATHLRNADRKKAATIVPNHIKVAYHVINRPMKEKQATAGWRSEVKVKGKPLIEFHEDVFRSNLKDIMCGDGLPNVKVFDWRK